MPKVYICGPMTGIPNYNFGAFYDAQRRLAAGGYEVVNPAVHDETMGWVRVTRDGLGGVLSVEKIPGTFEWSTALAWDIEQLQTCDTLYLLPGWSHSRGACKEYSFALEHGLRILGASNEYPAPHGQQPLVGLVGFAQSGKDTLALTLQDLGWRRMAFADPLKALALECNPRVGWDEQQYWEHTGGLDLAPFVRKYGWEPAKSGVTGVREFLQNLGVGVRNVLGADTWVEALFKDYDPDRPTVITDVRFPNEIAAIRDRGGVIVRIERPGVGPANRHVSEYGWRDEPTDYLISNSGTLKDLAAMAGGLNDTLRRGQ